METLNLKDPMTDRVVPSVPLPPQKPLPHDKLFPPKLK